jgi:hypothetical protein
MNLKNAQQEMRRNFLGGFAGQLVSGVIWLVSSAVWFWTEPRNGMAVLFFGSMAIFPLTQLFLRLLGRSAKASPENDLWALGSQIAFTVPINFLLVGAATLYRQTWFYPAAMIVVGGHYLPFITLYGMKMFAILAALLVVFGTVISFYIPSASSLGGWVTAIVLIVFAFLGRKISLNDVEA